MATRAKSCCKSMSLRLLVHCKTEKETLDRDDLSPGTKERARGIVVEGGEEEGRGVGGEASRSVEGPLG